MNRSEASSQVESAPGGFLWRYQLNDLQLKYGVKGDVQVDILVAVARARASQVTLSFHSVIIIVIAVIRAVTTWRADAQQLHAGFFGIPEKAPRSLFIANTAPFTSVADVDRVGGCYRSPPRKLPDPAWNSYICVSGGLDGRVDFMMKPKRWSLFRAIMLALMCLTGTVAVAQKPTNQAVEQHRDGQILSSKPWPSLPDFESLDDFSRNYFPRGVYEEASAQKDFDVLEITYSSDGLPVRGMLIEPKTFGNRKWPAIIFNRGGTGDFSRITTDGATPCNREHPSCLTVVDLYQFAKAGFVVIASDYRFHGATAKRDEWGGVDVDDVLNLLPALKSFEYVDPERLYMLGISRGGTMAYIALKRGMPVKASAIIAGPSDLKAWADLRPDMINGDDTYDGFAKVWPDYPHNSTELYRARSAVCWADQINVPVLILHSRTDSFVPVTQALRMAEALQEKGKVYALQIYDHDGHSLPLNREERNHRIVDWFNKFGAKVQLQ